MQLGEAQLVRHPRAPWPGPELAITASCSVGRDDNCAWRFDVEGDLRTILWPPPAAATRVDGLWGHTCFEVFVGPAGATSYVEFNAAPSGRWAAYAFDAYRAPAKRPVVRTPAISSTFSDQRASLTALVDPRRWLARGVAAPLEVGLSAVIEHRGGALGYFALSHPTERPDFHDRRGFGLRVGPAPHSGGVQAGSAR